MINIIKTASLCFGAKLLVIKDVEKSFVRHLSNARLFMNMHLYAELNI